MSDDITTCYSVESAWFQRLKLKYGKTLSNLAFNPNLRRYVMAELFTECPNPSIDNCCAVAAGGGHLVAMQW